MKNNYALGLTVGITNMFAKGSKTIQREYKKLDSETKKLQKTMRDIADFKDATKSLEKLGQSSDATTNDIRQQERALNRLSKSLKDSGIDTHNLISEQKKLERQLKQTESVAKRFDKLNISMESVTGAAAGGGGIATALIAAGKNMNKQEAVVAAQTGMTLADVQRTRNARLDIQKETGADSAMVMANWTQALQSGFKGKEALELTKTTSQLAQIAPQWDPQEILGAQMRMVKTYGISAARAADILLNIFQKSGDDKNGLLDNFMEYTSLFSGKGLSLEALTAQFIAGKQSGIYNYDKIADANKEVFQARLTDPGEFAKLVGEGEKEGLIDDKISNKQTALELKNALYSLRDGVLKKENIDKRYATLMMRIVDLYNSSDPDSVGAAKIVAEGVGGTIYSEDIGEAGLAAMAKAMADPQAVIGQVDGTVEKAMNVLITPSEQLANSLNASYQAASTSAAALEYLAAEPIEAASSGLFRLADIMNGNLAAASTVSFGAVAAGGFLGKALLGTVANKIKGLIYGASIPSGGIGKVSSSSKFMSASKIIKPLAVITSGGLIAKSIADGDYKEATEVGGSLAGGLAGMQLGASMGILGGPIGVAIGGAAGGIIGGIVGEELLGSLYDYFAGDDAKKQDEEINRVATIATQINKAEQAKTSVMAMKNPIAINISAPIQIESGAVVPDDFEHQMMAALRNATPELILQLRQTMNETLTTE